MLPDLTTPPSRGYEVRATSLANELKSRFTVELITADGQPPTRSAQHRRFAGLRRAALPLARHWPLQTALYDGPAVAARALEFAVAWEPEVIVVVTERLPFTTIALAKRFPLVLDIVDSMALHMSERAARATPIARWFWKSEAARFSTLAAALTDSAQAVVAASASARDAYPRATVIPNASSIRSRPRPAPLYDLAFTGNLWYWPNVEAVRVICEGIVPLVRRRLPNVRVIIAGRDPTRVVRMLSSKAGVSLQANVPDLGDLLASSRIALAPIEWTPGANLKILDALAVGTPVLTFGAAAAQLPGHLSGVVTCAGADEMALIATELLLGERPMVTPAPAPGWSDRADTLSAIIYELRARVLAGSDSRRTEFSHAPEESDDPQRRA